MKYKTILFDLDGTLRDSSLGIFNGIRHAVQTMGLKAVPEDQLPKFIGPPLQQSFGQWLGLEGDDLLEAVRVYRAYYNAIGAYENTLYSGIPDMLQKLKDRGLTLCVCTSKPQSTTEKILDYLGISQYFDHVAGASEDLSRAHKKDIIAYLSSMASIPDPAVMVGDTHYDIQGARAMDLPVLAVTWGYGTLESLAGADGYFDDPQALTESLLDF